MAEKCLKYLHVHSRLQRGSGHGMSEAVNVQPGNAGSVTGLEKGLPELLRAQGAYIERLGGATGAAQGIDDRGRQRQRSATCRRLWCFVDGRSGDCHALIFDVDLSGAKINITPPEAEQLTAPEATEQREQPNMVKR